MKASTRKVINRHSPLSLIAKIQIKIEDSENILDIFGKVIPVDKDICMNEELEEIPIAISKRDLDTLIDKKNHYVSVGYTKNKIKSVTFLKRK